MPACWKVLRSCHSYGLDCHCTRPAHHPLCPWGQFVMMPINEEIPEKYLSLKVDFKDTKFVYLIKIWIWSCHVLYNPLTLMSILIWTLPVLSVRHAGFCLSYIAQPDCWIPSEYWPILALVKELLSFQSASTEMNQDMFLCCCTCFYLLGWGSLASLLYSSLFLRPEFRATLYW